MIRFVRGYISDQGRPENSPERDGSLQARIEGVRGVGEIAKTHLRVSLSEGPVYLFDLTVRVLLVIVRLLFLFSVLNTAIFALLLRKPYIQPLPMDR